MRIFSLTNCILTFLLGWIFGSIFIFFLLSSQEQFISHNKHVVLLNPNYNGDSKDHTKSFLRYQTHQHTLMPEHLPDVEAATVQKHDPIHEGAQKDDGADKEEKPFIIYLYWPYPEDQFSIHQYKALESILSNFPNALIRITLLPTIQQFQLLTDLSSLTSFHDLKNTKISAFLHPKLFDKYRKMSYRIEVTFITLDELTTTGHNHNLFQRESWNQDNTISLGKSYLKNHVTPCCEDCEILCFVPSTTQNFNKQPDSQNFHTEEKSPPHTSPTVPYHLITYLHTLLLFKTGGIFSDFSFYFINPLESPWIHQGYFIHAYCTHVKPTATLSKHRRHHSHKKISSTSMYSHDIQIYYPKLYDNWKELQCYSSSLYYFPTKRNIILQCLLEKYHDDKVFLICIDSDTFFHGANCIREALDQCLHRINEERMNKLNAKSLVSLYSTFLNSKLRTEQQPSFLINSFSNELPQDINNHPIKHESSTLSPQDLVLHDRVTGLLETFQDNPMIANHTILSVHNWTVNSNTRILWLGHLAWQQIHLSSANGHLSSQAHHHQHHFYPYPKGSLLSIAETRNRQYKLYRFVPSQSSQSHEGKRANQRFYSCRYFHDHVIIPQYLLQLIEKQHSYWHQQFTNAQSNPTSNLANIFEAVSPHPSQISQNVSSNEKPFSTKLPINVSKLILNRSDSEVMNEAGTLSLNISSSQTNHTFHMTPTETNFSLSSYSTLPVLPLVNSSLEANATYTSSTQSVISTGYNLTVRHLNDTHSDLWNSSQAIEPHKYHLRGYHDKRMKRRRLNELTAPLKDKILLRDYFHKKSVLRTNHTNYEISLIDVLYPSLKGSFHSRLVEVSFGKDENTEVEISNQKDEIHFENDLSCNPSIFIVGFLHSSSQILLNYFHQHPRLLMGFSSVHSFPKGELLKSEVHVDGCYNVISPKYYTNSEWFQLSSSQETTAEFSKSFSRADCYPYIDHNESFIAVDASMQYNTNPFTPFLIKQDHPQAKILFLVENPVHRLMKHSKRFCHQLKQTEFYGFENLDRYLMSFIDHSSSILSKFRILVSQYLYWQDHKSESEESKKPEGNDDDNKDNQLDLYQIIEFYYFDILLKHYRHPSVDLSEIEMEKKDFSRGIREELQKRKKEQDQIGLELFLHSFYLPVMYYYMNIFPIENIIVLNTERFMNPRRAGNNTYQSVDTHIKYVSKELHIEYDEIGPNSSQGNDTRVEFLVPPHSYEKVLKNLYSSKLKLEQHSETEKERVESDLDDDQIYSNSPECELSIDVYDKLVHFFTPFNLILEQYLNFSIAHWNEEYDVDEVNYRPINLNTLYTLGMNDTRPMLWYELKDEEYNHKLTSSPKKKVKIASNQLVDKLVPQRNSEEDSGFNTTLGMLNTF